MDDEPSYCFVRLTLEHGRFLPFLAALFPLALIVLLAWPAVTATGIAAGVLAGIAAGVLTQLLLEIVRVIADTLLPR